MKKKLSYGFRNQITDVNHYNFEIHDKYPSCVLGVNYD